MTSDRSVCHCYNFEIKLAQCTFLFYFIFFMDCNHSLLDNKKKLQNIVRPEKNSIHKK